MRSPLPLVIALLLLSLFVAGCGGSRKNTLNTLISNNYSATVTLMRTTTGSPAAGATTRLSSHGIGGVQLGATKAQTVAELSRLFGSPSRRFISDACGPTYSEVAWGHLYVEFRRNMFSGYRYLGGAWLRSGVSPGDNPSAVRPRLGAVGGITIGDTLQQLRRAEGKLSPVGTSRWSRAGLIFYVNAQRYPDPPGSRIIEVKSATTCGDF